jgi:hypothetical protein
LKRYFKRKQLTEIRDKLETIERRYNHLLLKYSHWQFENEHAREFAQHGFMRRVGTLRRCIENVFRLVPPGAVKVPSRPKLHDIQINIQAFIANVYGATDNLAWIWVHERGLASEIPRKHVGFRANNTRVRASLPREFQDYLKTLDPWMKYVIEYRDALAHRIPLYVPPGCVPKREVAAYNDLAGRMTEALYVKQNGLEYERLATEQEQLLVFQPMITHSIHETTGHYVFHVQLIADFLTIEEMGLRILTELKGLRGGNR